jgi:hypothetical protein
MQQQQQQQSQDLPFLPVPTVSTVPAGIVVLDDELLSHVAGGLYGPAGTW